jgi:hypothetical protein
LCPTGPSNFTTIHIQSLFVYAQDPMGFSLVVTSESTPITNKDFWRLFAIGDLPFYQLPFNLKGAITVSSGSDIKFICQKDARNLGNNRLKACLIEK